MLPYTTGSGPGLAGANARALRGANARGLLGYPNAPTSRILGPRLHNAGLVCGLSRLRSSFTVWHLAGAGRLRGGGQRDRGCVGIRMGFFATSFRFEVPATSVGLLMGFLLFARTLITDGLATSPGPSTPDSNKNTQVPGIVVTHRADRWVSPPGLQAPTP